MEIIKIEAPSEALYLSEFMDTFPNGVLNKRETGVGATTISIKNNEPYIIAVPLVELIINKCSQHPELIGVHGDLRYNEFNLQFQENLKKGLIPKIMVTYDSLPKLVNWLSPKYNVYKDFKLLIDEFHVILTDYNFRGTAIIGLIEESLQFEHKCFVSATPISAEYTLPDLKDLQHYEIVWTKTTRIKPVRKKTNKPFMAVVNIIRNYIASNYEYAVNVEGKKFISKEAYFFVNSVKAIKDIITNSGLKEDEYKIICADNPGNRVKLGNLKINNVADENKPFTFITSKAFLGADFYSDTGITYVITNVNSKTCMYSIETEIFQIAGRIRTTTNPFKNYIYHIYNTGATDMSRADFEMMKSKKKQDSLYRIETFNTFPQHLKDANRNLYKLRMSDSYTLYNEKTDILEYDTLEELSEDFKFKMVYETYTNGLTIREAYIKAGFDMSQSQMYSEEAEDFIEKATTIQFKSILKEYCDLYDNKINNGIVTNQERIDHLLSLEPKIKDYVNKLGTTKVRALGYNVKLMKQGIYQGLPEVNKAIKIELSKVIEFNKVYTSKEMKDSIQNIYNILEIKKSAKATDLETFFKVDKKKRSINGKAVDSIIILN